MSAIAPAAKRNSAARTNRSGLTSIAIIGMAGRARQPDSGEPLAVIIAASLSALLVAVSLALPLPRLLVFNPSPSVPTGFYLIGTHGQIEVGHRVLIDPPPALETWLAERDYLSAGTPLIKSVAAKPGQTVCRFGAVISIDGRQVAVAQITDHLHRPLLAWSGCKRLEPGEVFVLNPARPDSLDGRYFGPLPASSLVGRAIPVWTDEQGSGANIWFAQQHPSPANIIARQQKNPAKPAPSPVSKGN